MATPPPTDTPAPLRSLTADEIASIERRLEYENIGKAWVRGLLATISNLRARNEALTAERDGWKHDFTTAQEKMVTEYDRAESLERRNHDLAQDLEKADAVIAGAAEAQSFVSELLDQEYRGNSMRRAPSVYDALSRALNELTRHRARRAGEEGEG